jgi:hypothetical protein
MRTRELTKLFPRPAAPRFFVRALLAFALLQAACTDGYDASSPDLKNRARVPLRAIYAVTPSSTAPVNRIRVTVDVDPSGPRFGPFTFNVDPNQSDWALPIELQISAPVNVMVLAELINVTNNTETVQYSGRIGPIRVRPGDNQQSAPPIPLYPGDPTNLDIKSIQVTQPPPQLEGTSLQLRATVQGGSAHPTILWRSLTPGIATVDDLGVMRTLLPGIARIEANAGPKSAAVEVVVNRRMDRVLLTPGTITLLSVGASADFSAVVVDPRGQPFTGLPLVWTVADNTVAEVTAPGKVRAKAGGRTTVTAAVQSAPELKGSAVLIVDQRISKLAISPTPARIEALNGTLKFVGSARDVNDAEVASPGFKWTSSAPTIATIDENGVARAVAPGKTVITLEGGGLSVSADLEVDQKAVSMQVWPAQHDFTALSSTRQFAAEARDANNFIVNRPVIWSTTNGSVVQVTFNGVATAVGNGTALVVAKLDNAIGWGTVNVRQLDAAIVVNATSLTMKKTGDTFALQAKVVDANNAEVKGASLGFASANTKVATITSAGLVTAVGPGQTEITVSRGGLSVRVAVKVEGEIRIEGGDRRGEQ